MKNVLWFLLGIIGGFVVAHLVNKDPRGHELLAEVDARIGEFTDRIGDAYREQEARFSDVVDAAQGCRGDAESHREGRARPTRVDDRARTRHPTPLDTAKDAASDAADAAKDAASDAVERRQDAANKLTD